MVGEPRVYAPLLSTRNIDDLLELGVGDPRFRSGSTPLIGAVISGQASIVRYLLDQGARPDVKTETRLDTADRLPVKSVFFANAKKNILLRRR